jgi:predicted transcriptional regulator
MVRTGAHLAVLQARTSTPSETTEDVMRRRRARPAHGGKGGAEPRLAIVLREQRVVELHLERHSQAEIAQIVGISQPAVSKILRRFRQRVSRETSEQWQRRQARFALFCAHITRESLRQYDAMKEGVQRQRQVKKTNPAGATTVVQEMTVEKRADPRFLELAFRTEERAAAIGAPALSARSTGETGALAATSDGHLLTFLTPDTLERALKDLDDAGKPSSGAK